MTNQEIIEQLKVLPTAEQLAPSAQLLLADYTTDPELTAFTVLDGEPLHAYCHN